MPTLIEALDRLRTFRQTFNAGEPVDDQSGLTADDLDTIISACTTSPEDQVIEQLGDFA